ncbi:2-C-methyl-D-erythritol 4-phosphate cytidylyltransferase [Alkalicoccus halolimnae]|uniref:2-C-methyl-D-erythritol 4-phosphate cytidylyltransferase n=1 Tax=Alkalicoccus halolimnae TaxID=1667239 RepID=A0A5C7F3I5_9BACI|nr:2-C-methyl-D-erythritol 4-phosphate cytidylyltransferase [Alkalicoccus halolimnae]TXF83673.1 2-C-methyl-D-erythritol 4-phosphate cytidylyltransferase [Alkalicoccus halolimnae]
MHSYQVILLAAGQGKRMKAGRNKQFLMIAGTPLLIHTLRVFEEDSLCKEILLVVNERETQEINDLIRSFQLEGKVRFVSGGKERQDSVANGLSAAAQSGPDDIVFIHDAARPFVMREYLHRLSAAAFEEGGAILAVPVKDTVKEVDGIEITKTTDRSRLWLAQTPQAFRYSVIAEAHARAAQEDHIGTDDASLVEYIGGRVTIVEGNYENFKVTTPEDMMFAEAVIKHRLEGGKE